MRGLGDRHLRFFFVILVVISVIPLADQFPLASINTKVQNMNSALDIEVCRYKEHNYFIVKSLITNIQSRITKLAHIYRLYNVLWIIPVHYSKRVDSRVYNTIKKEHVSKILCRDDATSNRIAQVRIYKIRGCTSCELQIVNLFYCTCTSMHFCSKIKKRLDFLF